MNWKLKEFERSSYKILEVVDENGEVIKTFVADELTYSEKKKKAQLMAAAPELLEVAEKSIDTLIFDTDCEIDYKKWVNDLKRVIKKAKGDGR